MTRRIVIALAAIAALTACQPDETKVDTSGVEPPASWNAIPDGKPSGQLHGAAFQAEDARIYVTDKPGRQWVTISISAAKAAEPCAALEPETAPSVWIRIPGAADEALAVRELERSADATEGWSVHYQVPRGDEPWIGRAHAAARFAIRRYVPGFGIDGELAVCFADGMGSCVSGSFTAHQCPNPVSPNVRQLDPAPQMPPKPATSASASASAAPAAASASAGASPSADPSTAPSAAGSTTP